MPIARDEKKSFTATCDCSASLGADLVRRKHILSQMVSYRAGHVFCFQSSSSRSCVHTIATKARPSTQPTSLPPHVAIEHCGHNKAVEIFGSGYDGSVGVHSRRQRLSTYPWTYTDAKPF